MKLSKDDIQLDLEQFIHEWTDNNENKYYEEFAHVKGQKSLYDRKTF